MVRIVGWFLVCVLAAAITYFVLDYYEAISGGQAPAVQSQPLQPDPVPASPVSGGSQPAQTTGSVSSAGKSLGSTPTDPDLSDPASGSPAPVVLTDPELPAPEPVSVGPDTNPSPPVSVAEPYPEDPPSDAQRAALLKACIKRAENSYLNERYKRAFAEAKACEKDYDASDDPRLIALIGRIEAAQIQN